MISRRTGWSRLTIAAAFLAGMLYVAIATISVKLPGSEITPAGVRQETSAYLKMRDGVEIAVTVLLPPDLRAGERVPVLMRTTRYWRGQQIGWGLRVMMALRLVDPSSLV